METVSTLSWPRRKRVLSSAPHYFLKIFLTLCFWNRDEEGFDWLEFREGNRSGREAANVTRHSRRLSPPRTLSKASIEGLQTVSSRPKRALKRRHGGNVNWLLVIFRSELQGLEVRSRLAVISENNQKSRSHHLNPGDPSISSLPLAQSRFALGKREPRRGARVPSWPQVNSDRISSLSIFPTPFPHAPRPHLNPFTQNVFLLPSLHFPTASLFFCLLQLPLTSSFSLSNAMLDVSISFLIYPGCPFAFHLFQFFIVSPPARFRRDASLTQYFHPASRRHRVSRFHRPCYSFLLLDRVFPLAPLAPATEKTRWKRNESQRARG